MQSLDSGSISFMTESIAQTLDACLTEAPNLIRAPLLRRLSVAFYESALAFGVYFAASYLYSSLTRTTAENFIAHDLKALGFQCFIFLIFGIYFSWSWSNRRRTLPQKTWGVRLLMRDGKAVTQTRAFARYCLAWVSLVFLLGFFYAWFDTERAFLHDRLLGTRLVLDEQDIKKGLSL